MADAWSTGAGIKCLYCRPMAYPSLLSAGGHIKVKYLETTKKELFVLNVGSSEDFGFFDMKKFVKTNLRLQFGSALILGSLKYCNTVLV